MKSIFNPILFSFILLLSACNFGSKSAKFSLLQNRQGIYYQPNEQTPFTGIAVDSFPNSQIAISVELKNGVLDGKAKEYFESGQIKSEKEFKNGQLDGKYTIWYSKGQKQEEGEAKNGKLNWDVKGWSDNGTLIYENNFVDGNQNGKCSSYFADGKLNSESNYKDGLLDGVKVEYSPNGQKKLEGNYTSNKQNGLFKWYDDNNGTLLKSVNYTDGMLDVNSFSLYDEKGTKIDISTYLNGTWKASAVYKSSDETSDGYAPINASCNLTFQGNQQFSCDLRKLWLFGDVTISEVGTFKVSLDPNTLTYQLDRYNATDHYIYIPLQGMASIYTRRESTTQNQSISGPIVFLKSNSFVWSKKQLVAQESTTDENPIQYLFERQ